MRSFLKVFLIVTLCIIAIFGISVLSFLIRGGAFDTAQEIGPSRCETIKIASGSAEDITVDRETGIAYLSVLDRRGLTTGKDVEGTILQLDLNDPLTTPRPALADVPEGFRPHGISLIKTDDGNKRLFVINHEGGLREKIEIFEQADDGFFSLTETLTGPLLTHPNDLVAVGRRQFYIANDSGATNALERAAEMLFAVGLSPLVYFDGNSFRIADSGLKSSGGINVDLEKGLLYVGETMGEAIRVYKLKDDRSTDGLTAVVDLDGAVDNIDIDSQGNLWIANHINTLSLVLHFGDENSPAPSQVQTVSISGSERSDITTVLETLGEDFSAASVAVKYGSRLIVGSITEPALMICEL